MAGSLSEQEILNKVYDATNSVIKTSTAVTADIEIGAVEIKNSTDDTRATVGANGLYTDVRASALPTGAATETTLAAAEVHLSNLDTNTPAKGTAAMAASTPVTVASDDTLVTAIKTAVEVIDNCISGSEAQVDVVGSLPAGSNIIGNFRIDQTTPGTTNGVQVAAALPAGTNNIGDVDVASIAAGSNIIGNVRIDQTTPGTTNGVQVAAALPAGTNNIGDVDVASIAAGDNNIGNVDVVSLPSGNISQQAMAASLSTVPANNITDATYIGDIKFGESLPAGTAAIGSITNSSLIGPGNPTVDSYASAVISAAANTANQSLIAAPGASKQIWVYGISFTVGTAAGSASFQDEDDTAISGVMPFADKGGMVIGPTGNFAMPIWKVATNKALEVDTVTCDIKGSIQYAVVSV